MVFDGGALKKFSGNRFFRKENVYCVELVSNLHLKNAPI